MDKKEELLSALKERYLPPVDQLLQITPKLEIWAPWLNYTEQFNLTREHIPQLIQMLDDEDILWADYETMPEINDAQIHAWRALSELPSTKAIPKLLTIWSEADPESDLENEDILTVLHKMGPISIDLVSKALNSKKYSSSMKIGLSECLTKIGQSHPESRNRIAKVLGKKLASFKSNDRTVNAFLVAGLMNLDGAIDRMSLIERVYENRMADLGMCGDLEEIKVELGLLEKRITPLPEGTTNWMQIDALIEMELEQEALEREQRKLKQSEQKRPIKKKVRRLKKGKRKS
ncbi:MAG: hypothetical protein AAF902_15980 [Chloroflexota bacterium]